MRYIRDTHIRNYVFYVWVKVVVIKGAHDDLGKTKCVLWQNNAVTANDANDGEWPSQWCSRARKFKNIHFSALRTNKPQ